MERRGAVPHAPQESQLADSVPNTALRAARIVRRRRVLMVVVRRLGGYVLSIWAAFTVTFIFFHLIPGSPIDAYAQQMENQFGQQVPLSSQVIAFWNKEFGLNGNVFEQYYRYLTNTLLRGNMGPSFIAFPEPASELIFHALPWTVGLFGSAVLISWIMGLVAGLLLAWFKDTVVAPTLTTLALAGAQIPYYLAALGLVFLFAFILLWLPQQGAYAASLTPHFDFRFIGSVLKHSILPGCSLVITSFLGWAISTRALVVSIMGEDFLLYAEAKGLRTGTILRHYVLRNAMLPQITGLGISLGFAVNGAYLVSYIFNYPGIGLLLVNALTQLDYNVLEGIVLISIVTVLTANLLLDLCLPLVDPRIE